MSSWRLTNNNKWLWGVSVEKPIPANDGSFMHKNMLFRKWLRPVNIKAFSPLS